MTQFGLFIAFLAGCYLGYGYAHFYVGAECRRLGGFFVGEQVYECSPRGGVAQ